MHQGTTALTMEPAREAVTQKESTATAPEAVVRRRATPVTDAVLATADRFRWWLFGVAAAFYVAGFTGVWRPEPDAALYMSLGRNLAEGRGYTYLGRVDELAYPGFPYLLAGVFKVFGTGSLFVPHLAVLLMTVVTLVLTYAYFRLHTTRAMAVLVTFHVAVANALYLCTFQLRNDVPFLMGVMAFLAGYEAILRRSRRGEDVPGSPEWGLRNAVTPWVLLCAGLAVAVATRPTMLALVAAIGMAAVWAVSRGSVRKRYVVATLAVMIAAVVAFYALDPRRSWHGRTGGIYEQVAMNWLGSPGRLLERMARPRTFDMFSRAMTEAILGHELWIGFSSAVSVTFLAIGLWILRRRPLWLFYLLATILMLMVMAVLDQPHQSGEIGQLVPRHFVGALPLLAYLWWRVAIWLEERLPRTLAVACAVAMAGLAICPNLAKACETLVRQRAYAASTAQGNSETNTIEELGTMLRERVEEGATVVVPHKRGRQIAFYGGRRTVDANPALKYEILQGPVYVLEQGEASVADFLKRNGLKMEPAIAQVPGRKDWRGHQQRFWALHTVVRKPVATPATKP